MAVSVGLAGTIVGESAIALLLTVLILRKYVRSHHGWDLYWGVGLALVAFTMGQEAVFYLGMWSEPFAQLYLVLVALLVGVLSLGSAELSLHGWGRRLWFGYIALTGVALAVLGFLYTVPSSIVVSGVVSGIPPTPVLIASSVVTFPASGVLIGSALYGALWQKRRHLLFVAAGTLVIAAAGSLYIASFPLSLYYAEFAGVVLLFFGFVRVPLLSPRPATVPAV